MTKITGLSVDTLLKGSATGGPISVNDLFALSSSLERLPLETSEVRYRPCDSVAEAYKSDDDSLINKGTPASTISTLTEESKRFHPTLYGFAWKDVPATSLAVSFIQNIEWRPDGQSGIVNPPIVQLHDPGYLPKLLHMMDAAYPGWQGAASGIFAAGARQIGGRLLSRVFAPQNLIR
jgi:hypothetical protein